MVMNQSRSTTLRLTGAGHNSWFTQFTGADLNLPFQFQGSASRLDRFRPDVVAVRGNQIEIVEVASNSQMAGGAAIDGYEQWIQNVQAVASRNGLEASISIVDVNGTQLADFS